MFLLHAFALLCLVSVSRSAPPACSDLLRPLDQVNPQHLEGRRALVAGSVSQQDIMERFEQRDSATADFSSNSSESNISFRRSMRSDNDCLYGSYNISLEGNSFTFDDGRVNTTFIHTSCPDCVLLSFNVESGMRRHFYLFSRRRQLEQSELEEFRAQVECLNMPPPAVMDPTKELCPEEAAGNSAA